VIDEHGRQLAMGRNLAQLRAQLGQQAGERFSEIARPETGGEKITDWTIGDLADIHEIRRGAETLVGYPALVDRGDHVTLEVFDDPDKARATHGLGLRRLFMLRLREQARHLEKNLPALREMALQFALLGDADSLKRQLVAASFECACMAEPWPATRAAFDARCDEAKSRVSLIGQQIARLTATILTEHQALIKRLAQAKPFPALHRDVREQLDRLLGKGFIEDTPFERLQHFPRYLKAASLRIDKLRADPERDKRPAAELAPLWQMYLREQLKRDQQQTRDARLEQFRWLLEELRVQLFAQELKTPVPVSVKRLTKMWQAMGR